MGTFLIFTTQENSRLHSFRGKHLKNTTATRQSFSGNGRLLSDSLSFLFFIKQKLRFTLKSCLCTFSKWEMQTISCYWATGCLYGLVRQRPSLRIRLAWRRGSTFSHTLRRRTLKCYLMLVGVHVDTVGFLGVPQKVCTIILPFTAVLRWCTTAVISVWNVPFYFWGSPLSGLQALQPLAHSWLLRQSPMIGPKPPDDVSFLMQDIFEAIVSTFLRCNILYKELWLTERTRTFTTVYSHILNNKLPCWDFQGFQSIPKREAEIDTNMMTNMMRKSFLFSLFDCNSTTICYRS